MPLGSQRTAVTSIDQVPDRLFETDPVGSAVKVLLQPTPFESQNCCSALTPRNEPLGIAAAADWFRASGINVAPAPAPPLATVKVWPPTETVVDPGTAALNAATGIELTPPLRTAVVDVVFGCPAEAMFGSSGGRSSLLTKPPFWLNPAWKS